MESKINHLVCLSGDVAKYVDDVLSEAKIQISEEAKVFHRVHLEALFLKLIFSPFFFKFLYPSWKWSSDAHFLSSFL